MDAKKGIRNLVFLFTSTNIYLLIGSEIQKCYIHEIEFMELKFFKIKFEKLAILTLVPTMTKVM